MLEHITPVILTYNEAENIDRTLSRLTWANDIVVVDSDSTDATLEIVRQFPQARVFNHAYVTHADKWRYAVEETGLRTDWILRLDSDYWLSEALLEELRDLQPAPDVSAYRIGFDYAIFAHRLRASLYPANTILLRRGRFTVLDRGHTEAWEAHGLVGELQGRVVHDDWKATSRWINDQARNAEREFARIDQHAGAVGWLRRRPPLAPLVVFLYCLFGKGLILDGRAGIFYTLQRTIAEMALSLTILEQKLRERASWRK